MSSSYWPAGDLEGVPNCPLCLSHGRQLLHAGLVDGAYGIADGSWDLFRCNDCSSAYLDPRPSESSIARAYDGYYTHDVADRAIVRRKGWFRRVLHDLINGYVNWRYGVNRTPALSAGRWIIPCLKPLRSAADCEFRHLSEFPKSTRGFLLDVGCGNGGFMNLAREAGWQAKGVDFDKDAIDVARSRGLDVDMGGMELLSEMREVFDVITLSHVVEHVHDPHAMLENAYRLLKVGGCLWLETPNIDSAGHVHFGRFWRGLESPRHLVLFSRKAMIRELSSLGFRSFRFTSHGTAAASMCVASTRIRDASEGSISATYATVAKGIVLEIEEMVLKGKREFLTLMATK